MIITINPDWRLASDPLQWTLQKHKLVKGEFKKQSWGAVVLGRLAYLDVLHWQFRPTH